MVDRQNLLRRRFVSEVQHDSARCPSFLDQLVTWRELGHNAVKTFAFRAVSPAIADEVLHLAMRKSGDGYELGTFASDGRQCVKASATA